MAGALWRLGARVAVGLDWAPLPPAAIPVDWIGHCQVRLEGEEEAQQAWQHWLAGAPASAWRLRQRRTRSGGSVKTLGWRRAGAGWSRAVGADR